MWWVVDGCRLVVLDRVFREIGFWWLVSMFSNENMCFSIWMVGVCCVFLGFMLLLWGRLYVFCMVKVVFSRW